jgi:hypothetical protein
MTSPERIDLEGSPTGLQEIPVVEQLGPMNFRPGLSEPPLCDRQCTAQAFECVYREHRRVILVVGVEMRSVVRTSRFDKHTNDDAKEPR